MRYNATNESVVVIDGGVPVTVRRGMPNFIELRRALMEERWGDARGHLRADTSLAQWARGRFTVVDGTVMFDGNPLPDDLNSRVIDMASQGEDPTPLFKFWELLQLNPSKRSVDQLWKFIGQLGIPLTTDGHFLAYKGVRDDLKDCHSGKFLNAPGAVIKMPRNQISDNPDEACHAGLHVGAREYASSFGPRMVICKVNPAHVVCVPNDHSYQKMRVCEYEVIGLDNGDYMPSTTISDDELPEIAGNFNGAVGNKLRTVVKVPAAFKKIHEMDGAELMDVTLEKLREYASKGLKIVGASRIPGGKYTLIEAIMKARTR